ncbi:hypothetical protein [Pelagibius sp. 7325]|uniref:hypothetical protein n=1 Tax=Pelagibius sp. 7325 TaxID=3131994 RepID=UPI0030EE6F7F
MVPGVYEWGLRCGRVVLLAGACIVLASASSSFAEARGLADVVYEFAVTNYCGTLTPAVEAGFRKELAQITAAGGFDDETARQQRIQGWIAAEREWRNRGLGGQRAWCADEGQQAARHFRAIAGQP